MAIIPESQYPGKITPASAEYPYGQARNITLPGDGTGTPWEAAIVNDIFGLQQALLSEAEITPSGDPETATESQYLEAAKKVIGGNKTTYVESVAKLEALSLDVGVNVYLTEDGKSGDGVIKSGSHPSDPQKGIYIDLANGNFWQRSETDTIDFSWFDSATSTDTDVFNAVIEGAKNVAATRIKLPDRRVYLVNNEVGGVVSFAAAVVFDGLNNCEIFGSGPSSELFAATGGTGTETFALFRIQNCNNLHFHDFKVEGDYANHTGAGGSRSKFVWLTTFDRDNPTVDLQEMRGIHFSNIECNDIGSFIGVARRGPGAPYAPNIYDVTCKHCHGVDAAQNDNVIGLNFVKGGELSYNKFKNTPIQNPPPVLFIDVSRGCENIDVKHNVGEFFVFGMKSESSPEGEVYAPSKQINFISNEILECGDPNSLSAGEGSAAGATYAFKIRTEGALVKNNSWTARTQLVTDGGLYAGILVALGEILKGTIVVDDGNNGFGSEYGIVHNRLTDDGLTKTIIKNNQIDAKQVGITAQVDCDVDDNDIFSTSSFAVDLQIASNSRARRNKAFNCGTTGGQVYNQGDGGTGTDAGYFEFIENEIHDDRGASAATNGYRLQAGLVYSKAYRIKPGTTIGLLGDVYLADYIGLFDRDSVKYSGQINGSTLSVVNGYNILSVTSVDANTIQINFKRPIPEDITPAPSVVFMSGGNFFRPQGASETYYRVRFVDSSGVFIAPSTFNIKG